jgi:hypothetical protein
MDLTHSFDFHLVKSETLMLAAALPLVKLATPSSQTLTGVRRVAFVGRVFAQPFVVLL